MNGETLASQQPVRRSGPYNVWVPGRRWPLALAVGLAYYAGAKFGFALTFPPNPVSILWPPNAILMAGLLLAPLRAWPVILAAVLPAHLFVELKRGYRCRWSCAGTSATAPMP